MIQVTGVRFQQDGKVLYYDPNSLTPAVGEYVVAETARGLELGEVVQTDIEIEEEKINSPLYRIVRIATARDIQQATESRSREREAYHICQKKIIEHNLEMKLVSVETSFDNGKMLFYFTANGRVDFRALVKDLASTFKTRIELRQIGVRDEARMLGGLGPCGRQICCGAFLSDFQPVSIKMAKEQNLSLNPTKISGVCGRLMCCLKYEQEQYEQTRKKMPRVGREVITPDGKGTVSELNILKETVSVRIPSGDATEIKTYSLEQISRPGADHGAPAAEEAQSEEAIDDSVPELENEEQRELSAEKKNQEQNRRSPRERKPRTEKPPRTGSRRAAETTDGADENLNNEAHSPKQRNPEKNRAAKEAKLGQPVRRENRGSSGNRDVPSQPVPEDIQKHSESGMKKATTNQKSENGNREVAVNPGSDDVQNHSANSVKKQAGNQKTEKEGKASRSKGWADALEKAMKEAGQEQ